MKYWNIRKGLIVELLLLMVISHTVTGGNLPNKALVVSSFNISEMCNNNSTSASPSIQIVQNNIVLAFAAQNTTGSSNRTIVWDIYLCVFSIENNTIKKIKSTIIGRELSPSQYDMSVALLFNKSEYMVLLAPCKDQENGTYIAMLNSTDGISWSETVIQYYRHFTFIYDAMMFYPIDVGGMIDDEYLFSVYVLNTITLLSCEDICLKVCDLQNKNYTKKPATLATYDLSEGCIARFPRITKYQNKYILMFGITDTIMVNISLGTYMMISDDGFNWSNSTRISDETYSYPLVVSNDTLCIINTGGIWLSNNLTNWRNVFSSGYNEPSAVDLGDGRIMIACVRDGDIWVDIVDLGLGGNGGVIYGEEKYSDTDLYMDNIKLITTVCVVVFISGIIYYHLWRRNYIMKK